MDALKAFKAAHCRCRGIPAEAGSSSRAAFV